MTQEGQHERCCGNRSRPERLPGQDFVDRVVVGSDQPIPVLSNLQSIFNHGRLAGSGYLSILPVDQGIEHSVGASFAPNPIYFDPERIVKLPWKPAATPGLDPRGARRHAPQDAHKIPFVLKLNHNELLTYPNKFDQVLFANVPQAADLTC